MELRNKYFLLRHGQTPYQAEEDKKNIIYPPLEQDNVPLTKKGEGQIEKAAQELKRTCPAKSGIDIIISSDFQRTRQTAGIVSRELGLEPSFDKRLRELNMGEFHNGPKEKYRNFFFSRREKFTKRPAGGENWNDLKERLADFLNETEQKYKNKNILIISHGDPLWFLVGIIKGLETDEEFLSQEHERLYPDVGQIIIL